MNANFSDDTSEGSQSVWDCPELAFDDQDDCSSQIPNFTHQFANTLKDNKGKPDMADFEKAIDAVASPNFARQKLIDSNLTSSPLKQQTQMISKRKLEEYKPQTFNERTSTRWRESGLTLKEKKLLRKISSDQILKVLFA
ncbi:unnamed protein product [Moneuplotes crassus]|uniref:Uncharacterized protein n=1 Tax=Euplotes crassus TaxID=5936 RepID=A0AAD1YC43_EUPCR|nr:unnamed protein product [Moneuplotes crassus]